MSRLRRAWAALTSGPEERRISSLEELRRLLLDGYESTGVSVTDQSAMRVGAVYRSAQIITGAIARMPVVVRERVGPSEFAPRPDHAIAELLNRRPNQFQKAYAARRLICNHLLFRGNSYWRIAWGVRGQPTALIPLNPDRVEVHQRPDLTLEYRHTTEAGRQNIYDQRDVLHVMGMSLDGITGVSPLTYAREAIGLSLATSRHGARTFRNGASVSSVLTHSTVLSDEARANLQRGLAEFRDPQQAGGTLVLEQGAELKPLGMSLIDAQFIDTINASRTEIAMFFGVPPHLLGDTTKQTSFGTGIESQTQGFATWTLGDWIAAIEDALRGDLLGPDERAIEVSLNERELLKLDEKTRTASHTANLQWGVMSPNEVRAERGMNPRAGGDIYYPPPNMTRDEGAGGAPLEADEEADDADPTEG